MRQNNNAPPDESWIDGMIDNLLSARNKKPGTPVDISVQDATTLCHQAREVLLSQPMLLELGAPIKICGDIHGQYTDLLRLFEYGRFPPEVRSYIFFYCLKLCFAFAESAVVSFFLFRLIIYSLEIMSTEGNSLSRLFVFFSRIRSSIQKTSSSYEVITSVLGSTGYMVSMMSAVAVSVSSFGRHSATPSTAYLAQL